MFNIYIKPRVLKLILYVIVSLNFLNKFYFSVHFVRRVINNLHISYFMWNAIYTYEKLPVPINHYQYALVNIYIHSQGAVHWTRLLRYFRMKDEKKILNPVHAARAISTNKYNKSWNSGMKFLLHCSKFHIFWTVSQR